ncbi:vanadium-dependent haloperoxidase [Pleurocapsa sp. PCC 7319]|uniref:vanadium-dependent haloperoxidase n=1 Tax=Pleurocapsa sp. PCC 7319 TaxID=118161 RepID=UPI0003490468|nr:vanadium-dependent haloperoxidase [Pleurocapsa sp. PCC 7319]
MSTSFTPSLELDSETQLVTVDDPTPTVSVLWDRAVQQAVINTSPGPTVASRAYAIVHTAMFDAWAAYDPQAISTQLEDDLQRPTAEITDANKSEAMSYSAYRVLTTLFPDQVAIFDELMQELGLDPNNTTTDTTTAAGIGNVSATALLEFRTQDGSNQLGNDPNGTLGVPYSDISGYQPINQLGETINIEHWTPERVPIDSQPGEEESIQEFLTPQWGEVIPFGLESGDQLRPEAPEPFLLVDGEVDLEAQTITLPNGSVLPISKDLIGTVINPEFIAQAEQVVNTSANLTDEQKLIAEFWEDGGGTAFPPGTWMTFGQFVSARDEHSLDDDAKLFFSLGNAVFDAGIATWEAKKFYDYTRPVRLIRDLGELGLIGEFNEELGGYAIEAWSGPGEGTKTILATDFLTYQTPGSHPSPPFAEYTSGHSSFSAAGAGILELFTGRDDFGATVTFEPGESRFEPQVTPQQDVTLAWETFTAAADEAGISRIYGGIHFEDGDLNGRTLGQEVAHEVWEEAQFYIQGGEVLPLESDALLLGVKDRVLVGSDDEDIFLADQAGNNAFVGQGGNDVFWVAHQEVPQTAHQVLDFELSQDVIGISGLTDVFSIDDLSFAQAGDSTLVAAGDHDLVLVQGVDPNDLHSTDNFTFL